jgi:hypothetical protein
MTGLLTLRGPLESADAVLLHIGEGPVPLSRRGACRTASSGPTCKRTEHGIAAGLAAAQTHATCGS